MANNDRQRRTARAWGIVVIAAVAVTSLALVAVPWLRVLLGRLHPIAVHFPIALLLAAAAAEATARWRTRGDPVRPDPLALGALVGGVATALLAVAFGFLNAAHQDFGGSAAETLVWHRALGVGTAVASVAAVGFALALRRSGEASHRRGYLAALAASALLVTLGGHEGGVLVFGDDYLASALRWEEATPTPASSSDSGAPVDFVDDVRPILEAQCIECHGPQKQKGSLRLDAKHLAIHGGRSGRTIVPGRPDKSMLLTRVAGFGGERRMPLDEDPLEPDQIDALRRWIAQGAPWPESASVRDAVIETHWSYVSVERPEPPEIVSDDWSSNDIDRFILARLVEQGLTPSPPATPEQRVRRLYVDLIGLPPPLDVVDAFVADPSDEAYDALVDRLLASPRFGEKWARHWLDLARYADSDGFERDGHRDVWLYRDWVIDAFNADMPFDQFTIEQLAGDLLPNANDRQRIATGFQRNSMVNREGGVDPDEAFYEVRVDRTNTMATAWLGSSVACAQCHDHKYDPISQRDYFGLMAFFSNADYLAGELAVTTPHVEPKLELPAAEQAKRRREIVAELDELGRTLSTPTPALEREQRAWEAETKAQLARWKPLVASRLVSTGGSMLALLPDDSVLVSGLNPPTDTYEIEAPSPLDRITAIRLEVLADPSLPRSGPGRYPDGEFVLTGFSLDLTDRERTVTFAGAAADAQSLYHEVRRLVEPTGPGSPRAEHGAAISGWSVRGSGVDHRAIFVMETPLDGVAGETLSVRLEHERGVVPWLGIGRFRLSVMDADAPFETLKLPGRVRRALATPEPERTDPQRALLASTHRRVAPSLEAARRRISALEAEVAALGIPTALVLAERTSAERPSAWLRERGAFTSPVEQVFADTPSFLPPLPSSQMPNRLGLARWIASDENPLTARVAVNRIWAEIFGTGIVATADDFGTQGAPPSHPGLLDWLASEFVANDWKTKSLIREIVRSATYRQSSSVTEAQLALDPQNRWLGRGARHRLPAELVRDVVLAAGGVLSERVGGPSVFPHQPPGVWDVPFNASRWRTSEGEDASRRGLYTYWRRTTPHPQLVTFDAPTRELCTAQRPRTNTPLQALALLNDRALLRATWGLAEAMQERAEAGVEVAATYGFRRVLSREPDPLELDALVSLYRAGKADYESAARRARHRGRGVEHSAWTEVATALLNLDETVNRL